MADHTDRWDRNIKNWRRLKRAGVGAFVVLSTEAMRAGLSPRWPIGQLVAVDDMCGVRVRRLGQSSVANYSAIFWEPAPTRLANLLVASFPQRPTISR
jgi:hypothetical protein